MRNLTPSNFAYPVFLALLWMLVTDTLTLEGFILGYLLSFIVIRTLLSVPNQDKETSLPIPNLFYVILYIIKLNLEVLVSGWNMFLWTLGKRPLRTGIIAVPLHDPDESPIVAAMTAHNITVTMGQSVVAYDPINKILYVHCLDVETMAHRIDDEQIKRVEDCRKVLGLD